MVLNKFTKEIVIVVLSSIVYGLLNYMFVGLIFPGSELIALRPQIIIPVAAGILMGPFSGAIVGGIGNVFGDFLLGYGIEYWHWSLANFIIGGVSGLIRVLHVRSIEKVNGFASVIFFVFLANLTGLMVGYIIHISIHADSSVLTVNTFLMPALISNLYVLLLLLPPVLWFMGYLRINMETRGMFLVIMVSMVLISLLTILFLVVEYQEFKYIASEFNLFDFKTYWGAIIARSIRWIGVFMLLVVIIGVFIGYSYSKRFVRPVHQLSDAALKISNGTWRKGDSLSVSGSGSEISGLVQVFNKMASDIESRENEMNETINALKFKVDKAEENKKLEQITETDFFKSIEEKSKKIRRKRDNTNR